LAVIVSTNSPLQKKKKKKKKHREKRGKKKKKGKKAPTPMETYLKNTTFWAHSDGKREKGGGGGELIGGKGKEGEGGRDKRRPVRHVFPYMPRTCPPIFASLAPGGRRGEREGEKIREEGKGGGGGRDDR